MNKLLIHSLLSLIFCVLSVDACLWDYDTLAMEKKKFPEALDLITGKFLRHTPTYYGWRIEDRLKRLVSEPENLALYDDLAAAYDKLGNSERAIELMIKKESIQSGLYETYANLGTFYIHNKQFRKGLLQIKQSIRINPDAHFGREIYQQKLVEYVVARYSEDRLPLPLNNGDSSRSRGFGQWILKDTFYVAQKNQELEKAEKGILGMMRFGHYVSPVLLEALGDILIAKGNAKRLASRAYLKASYECDDEDSRLAYRELAKQALIMQIEDQLTSKELTVEDVEASFSEELKLAQLWYSEIEKDEAEWRAKGLNLDEEFKRKYYK